MATGVSDTHAKHQGAHDSSALGRRQRISHLVLEDDHTVGDRTRELSARAYAELPVDPRQMRLDGRDRREQLRGDLAVRLALCYERGDPALRGRQLTIATRAWTCAPELVLGTFEPERCAERGEDLDRSCQRVRSPPTLPCASPRSSRCEESASTVEREAALLEPGGRAFGDLRSLVRAFAG
jgi:hypothetical protein